MIMFALKDNCDAEIVIKLVKCACLSAKAKRPTMCHFGDGDIILPNQKLT